MSLRYFRKSGSWFSVLSKKFSSFQWEVCCLYSVAFNICSPFWYCMINKWKESGNLFNQCGKRNGFGLILKGMIEVHGKILDIKILHVSLRKKRSVDFIYNISFTERIIKYLDFVSIDEKQVTETQSLVGISYWFATVNISDASRWSRLQTLNIWLILI